MDVTALGKVFVDTNILVYALDSDEREKQAIAQRLVPEIGPEKVVISAQVLGEFYWATTRRIASPLNDEQARQAVDILSRLTVVPIDRELVIGAVALIASTSITYWDALIVKAASFAGCDSLLTEDLHHDQVIDGVRVVNPFLDLGL